VGSMWACGHDPGAAVGKAALTLTALQVARLDTPGRHTVGTVPGLHLRILPPPSSARLWTLRVVVGTQRRDISLGRHPDITLADAIKAARAKRRDLLGVSDPETAPPKSTAPAPVVNEQRPLTFAQAAELYIAAHAPGWKHDRQAHHWRRSLELHALAKLGDLEVAKIGMSDVLRVLEPIWVSKTETANKVRGRIELIIEWADQRAGLERPNPARWHGHLDTQLPSRSKVAVPRHHVALATSALPAFMRTLAGAAGTAALALRFTILTAARSGEVREATWKEIDFTSRTWIIPAERTKNDREHRVPLSAAAIALLESIPLEDDTDVIFRSPPPRRGALSNMALVAVCRRLGKDCVPHGFRSSFRDWCAEHTDVEPEVAEMALGHAVAGNVEAAYRRGDLLVKRRKLMDEWASFLQTGNPSPPRPLGRYRVVKGRR
jgi:integrase